MQKQEAEKYVADARAAVASQQHQDALALWKDALDVIQDDNDWRCSVLVGRSRCYAEYATYLRSIPAEASERAAQFALEPPQLAKLGLADADRALRLQPERAEAHMCRANALIVLEDYAAAEDALVQTLSYDASNSSAKAIPKHHGSEYQQHARPQDALHLVKQHATAGALGRRRSLDCAYDDLDCILCCKLMHKPVTTPCGHSFCQGCFARAMDHDNKCPMCRRVLHTGRDLPITLALHSVICTAFTAEAEARQAELAAAGGDNAGTGGGGPLLKLPVFVMAAVMPGEPIALNIFEPRYRLMFRRCMEGNRRLAMTCALRDECSDGHFLPDIVTECDISDCQVQPDGRLSVQCVGVRRVHTCGAAEIDGYRVCHVDQIVNDELLPQGDMDGAGDMTTLPDAIVKLRDSCAHVLNAVTQQAEAANRPLRNAVLRHLAELSSPPDPEVDAEALTWWAARLLCVQTHEKLQMLRMTSTEDRACVLLAKMPNPARAGSSIVQMAMDGNSCSIM